MNRIPEEIKVIYIALLKNFNKVSTAMDNYYTDSTSQRRMKLLQEIAKTLKGTMSQRIIMAEKAMPILDRYNRYNILLDDEMEDIDFNDSELLTLLNKVGLTIK